MRPVRRSVFIAVTALFGAVHAALVATPGIWRSWMILIEPFEGVILGPTAGFTAALIGSIAGRIIRPRPGLFPLFGIAEPIGASVAGLIFKGRWKTALAIYAAMLGAYFIHPLGRVLPAWCLWDIYIAFTLIFTSPYAVKGALKERTNPKKLTLALVVASFIGIEADVLTRIFLLIPIELYKPMGIPEAALPLIWIAGAIETPIESIVSVIAAVIIGAPLLITLEKGKILKWPLT